MLIIAAYYWQSEWNPCCEPIFWAAPELWFRRWGQNSVPATLANQKVVSRKEDVWYSLHTTISTYHKDLVRTLQIRFFGLWSLWWPQTSPVRRYYNSLLSHPKLLPLWSILDRRTDNILHPLLPKFFFFSLSAQGPTRRHNSTGLAELWGGWPIELGNTILVKLKLWELVIVFN
jgi:hypothetical protein